uniref:Protein Churchill n=1 Tax=Holothuria glaberrima TaxID=31192 RepID=A0A0P0C4P6_HOLGL|nr:churchill [Holothuria glaberrima]
MCVDCVKERCPDRGSVCLDNGWYALNFYECSECHKKEPIKNEEKKSEVVSDGEEEVTFTHKCSVCNHRIAEHKYYFSIDGDFQEYSMLCILCGRGADTVSIQPKDPRKGTEMYSLY